LSKTAIYVIAGIIAVIVFSIIMHFINRSYRIRYNMNLMGGGFLVLVVAACVTGGVLLMKSGTGNKFIPYALFALGAVITICVFAYDIKKCGGGAGFGAFILQIIFSLGCILTLIDLFANNGRSVCNTGVGEEREIRRIRKERGYDDRRKY
jgi:uncharacterized membrane protein